MKTIYKSHIIVILLAIFSAIGCRSEGILEAVEENEGITLDTPDWTDATHGNNILPDYTKVFKQNEVIRIDLKIDAASWAKMQADLKTIMGTSSSGPGGMAPGGGGAATVSSDPVWVPCSVFFEGKEWYKVGVRYKGNSSLKSTYSMGLGKLSFKLDFDQFESDYPAIKNQRFYGFKQLNLKNNFDDKSFVREKVASDLFRIFGLASSQTAFCKVYVDSGSGAKYFGLYSLVEEVDDTVLDSQYADGSGNLYKPDGTAASFAAGSFNESQMDKQNNEELNDYADVAALYSAINSNTRTTSPTEWKAALEKVFEVDIFLKWLAANTVIQNWDTYGVMTHNYFLYNNPVNSKLNWIPWDNNEAFQQGKQTGALSLSLSEVGTKWPLIRYIMNDSGYKQKYKTYMAQFVNEVFVPAQITQLYDTYYLLLKEAAYAETASYSFLKSQTEFDSAISTLKSHVTSRNNAVSAYLQSGN